MLSTALAAVLSAHAPVAVHGTVNQPEYRHPTRSVLADPQPRWAGHARILTRNHPIAPDFQLAGPPYTTTPLYGTPVYPGPASFGADAWDYPIAFARIGETVHAFNPFERLPERTAAEYHLARKLWLLEHGYVEQARILARPGQAEEAHAEAEATAPKPRAVIKVIPKREPMPLQVHRVSPEKIVISNVGQTRLASAE